MTDVFSRALHDWFHDEFDGPLRYRDGEETEEHEVAGYFGEWTPGGDSYFATVDAPVLDMGAGAGRQALYCQEHAGVDVTAIEPSESLVDVLRDRGVADPRQADMFSLREHFERDVFRSAYSVGTQVGIVQSLPGLRAFLGDLAYVTTPDATALFGCYDPRHEATRDLIGFRADPATRGAARIVQYEYDDELGEPWLFRLFTPDEVRDAVVGTGWRVADVETGPEGWEHTYSVTLAKR